MAGIIHAEGLVKKYGDVVALDGLDLDVPEGTILGLLGPNGAGKTTAVSILTTLLDPDEGTATVAGVDLRTQPKEVRRRIGLSGQFAAVDEVLTGFENLDMIGRLYHLGRKQSRRRARELLDSFDLTEAADRPVKGYSGGMRRRLDVACALVAHPPVLFLDEPSTGLDPRSRSDLWRLIEGLVADGATLLLTTQYLEEADELADDILVIDHGHAIAQGTSDELKAQVGGERIQITVADSRHIDVARRVVERVAAGDVEVDVEAAMIVAPVGGGPSDLMESLRGLDADGVELADVGLRRPTLDDVFLTLTGHVAEHDGDTSDPRDHQQGDRDVEGVVT